MVAMAKIAGFGYRVVGGLNRPLKKLNLKLRYLFTVLAIRDPALLMKSFEAFMPSFIGMDSVGHLQEFLRTQYVKSRTKIKSQVMQGAELLMKSPLEASEGYSPELTKLYNSLYYEFHLYAIWKFLNVQEDALVKLDKKMTDLVESLYDRKQLSPLDYFQGLIWIAEVTRDSLRVLYDELIPIRNNRSHRYGVPKLSRIVTSYNLVLKSLSGFVKPSLTPQDNKLFKHNYVMTASLGGPLMMLLPSIRRLLKPRMRRSLSISLWRALLRRTG